MGRLHDVGTIVAGFAQVPRLPLASAAKIVSNTIQLQCGGGATKAPATKSRERIPVGSVVITNYFARLVGIECARSESHLKDGAT